MRKDPTEIVKHLEKMKFLFSEIKELCKFNEIEIPKKLLFLQNENEIQNIFILRKQNGATKRMKEINRIFTNICLLNESESSGFIKKI